MSSTNKTSNLGLNKWIGTDKPRRTDFVRDNEIIDAEITNHKNNSTVHVSSAEKNKWNNYIYVDTYFGDGASSRTVNTDCPFSASFGIVFAGNRPASVVKTSTSQKVNYVGMISIDGNSSGISFVNNRKSLKVTNSTQALMEKEYMNFNEMGITYHYILFR